MSKITRTTLHGQLADILRDDILTGAYPAGSLLPSEGLLAGEHGVSRPTVRNALAKLRAEGLITVRMGKGSIVRAEPETWTTRERAIARVPAGTESGSAATVYQTPDDVHTTEVERRAGYRASIGPATAVMRRPAEEPTFVTDRLVEITEPSTGNRVRVMHRLCVPFSTIAEHAPALETDPFVTPAAAYAALSAAHPELTWREEVTARMPLPDEASTLGIPDATPLLTIQRITYGRNGIPLLLEEIRTTSHAQRLAYMISADKTHDTADTRADHRATTARPGKRGAAPTASRPSSA